jgi:hypothetical protein
MMRIGDMATSIVTPIWSGFMRRLRGTGHLSSNMVELSSRTLERMG